MSAPLARSPHHWEAVYRDRGPTGMSWYQAEPRTSLELIADLDVAPHTPVIDAGGGSSALAACLVAHGFTDVTVVDLSETALETARRNLAAGDEDAVAWIAADLLTWRPPRPYGLWHDRAVFHFLTGPHDRATYLATLCAALAPGGAVIIGTFATDGPTHCSGLPVARYTPDDLAAELTAAFDGALTVTGHRTEHHRTPSGAVQPFAWVTARRR